MDNTSKNSLDVLNYLNDSVFIITFEGNILFVNKAACEQLGYSQEELLQKNIKDINTPHYAQLIPERIEQLKKHGKLVFESEHVKKIKVLFPLK
jgi:PAS domain S-box-containing protein